jgi:periplasmic protein TonB
MAAQTETLTEGIGLRGPLRKSVLLHLGLFGLITLYLFLQNWGRIQLGDPGSLGGGSVAVTPVAQLPLTRPQTRPNPLAADSPAEVPTPPKPEPRRQQEQPPPEPKAVAIPKGPAEPPKPKTTSRPTYRPEGTDRPNQVYSNLGRSISSPMYGGQNPGAGVEAGPSNPFGDRFGWYADLIRRRVAEKWRTGEIDNRIQTAPTIILSFDILRSGAVQNVRLIQRSGITDLDYSTQRAVLEASPFPPLPDGFQRNSATVEFWFQFKR